ncbi:MAG: hypothetical protein WD738_15600 [Pirellulales bacterium]
MSRSRSTNIIGFTIPMLLGVLIASCAYGPSRIEPPSISPRGAAGQAMEMHDADGDGFIAGQELDKVPGLKAAMETVDTDKDQKITADEIAERVRAWQATRVGVTAVMCTVTVDGQPLAGATVTFEPESFLGDGFQPAVSPTDEYGQAYPSIPKEKRALPDMPPGMPLGFYRVKISKIVKGKEMIPAVYNSETLLGQQIAPDDPAVLRHDIRFELKRN